MIQLNKRLYLTEEPSFSKVKIAIIRLESTSYPKLWKDVALGRRLAYKRGYIKSMGQRGESVYFTKLGRAMLNLMK